MVALFFVLAAITFTASIFLMARFGISKKEDDGFVTPQKEDE